MTTFQLVIHGYVTVRLGCPRMRIFFGAINETDFKQPLSMSDSPIRKPGQIRQDAARKLLDVQVSDHFRAILGCLLGQHWTTPRLVEMVMTPDGKLLGRCEGKASFNGFLSIEQFGRLLTTYSGWGMWIVFVPNSEIEEEPPIEVRQPNTE